MKKTKKSKGNFLCSLERLIIEDMSIYRLGIFQNSSYDLVGINAGQTYFPHYHKNSSARVYIIYGQGNAILNNREIPYRPQDIFEIKKGVSHGFSPIKNTLFLSIQTPPIIDSENKKIDIHYKNKTIKRQIIGEE